ncbi:MAG: T9SS type A sorting domain-containing protein, partial [Flavobacteriales bacterium]|nr:T9SS type A sorting domain-containing protein [Flavobacteriales bacterium]
VEGCTDNLYTEYNADANTDDGSCATLVVEGCTDPLYLEFDASANTNDGSCATEIVSGCTDSLACNYNSLANVDDASCYTLSVDITIQFLDYSLNTNVSPEDSVVTYAWSLNDSIISDSSALVPSVNGTYVVEVSNGECTDSDTLVVETLSLIDLEVANVNVYPNPATDVLNITFNNSIDLVDVQVVNTLGAVVLSRTLQSNGNGSFQLEVADLELGVYILKTISNGSTSSTPWLKK